MQVYLYDDNNVYTGSYTCQKSPLEPGKFIIPELATTIQPPVIAVDEAAVFIDGIWVVETDYRGQLAYNQTTGVASEITAVGPLPANTALTPPPPTLAQSQAAQIATLQAAYLAAINSPVSFKNAAGVTSTYPAGNTLLINGQSAQSVIMSVIAAGSAAWTLGKWLDTNNVAQTFTFADTQGLAAAMEAAATLDWQDLVAKIAEVQAATTVSAVWAIVW